MPPKKNPPKKKEKVHKLPGGNELPQAAAASLDAVPSAPATTAPSAPATAAPSARATAAPVTSARATAAPATRATAAPATRTTAAPSAPAIAPPPHTATARRPPAAPVVTDFDASKNDPKARIRKPSQRQQGLDPLAPLTPAPPKKHQQPRQRNLPKTPVPTAGTVTFAARQIQASRNRRAATVLFNTPRTPHTPHIPNPRGQVPNQPSPTPQSRSVLSPAQPLSSGSDGTEDDVRVELARLNLEPSSSSESESQLPPEGHHSNQARVPPRAKGAKDVWTFFEKAGGRSNCILCRKLHAADSSHHIATFGETTSTSTLRKHLFSDHIEEWSTTCDTLKIPITASAAVDAVRIFRKEPVPTSLEAERPEYSKEAFINALVDFVVGDDQSINVIESPHLRKIFLLLRKELKESDIPGRTTIRNQVEKAYENYMEQLQEDMAKSVGKISFTTDAWTDPNQTPFLAVTAHWIEAVNEKTTTGSKKLRLRADLIGFHNLPGRHTGEHLAHCFLFITDRVKVTSKIGWITCDNASNNQTMMESLQVLLQKRKIKFHAINQRIRCFPHIVNLACKAVLKAITNLDYVDDTVEGYTDYDPGMYGSDTIAIVRSLVNAIRNSSLKKQRFSEYVQKCSQKNYQLLRDVTTRWSSTLLMISRVIELREAVDEITKDTDFKDLHTFRLKENDWNLLKDYEKILEVPHAFQEILSSENTPTLCYATPAFAKFIEIWIQLMEDQPIWTDVIQPGLDKLDDYQERMTDTYDVAMAIDPVNKLSFYRNEESPEEYESAKRKFVRAIRASAATDPSKVLEQPAAPKPSRPTAADILGLNRQQARQAGQQKLSIEMEVDQYLSDPNQGTGILEFWQEHQHQYPRIFRLAMDIIPIQASSVPCERVFSSGKETMTPRRSRISAHLMECLQILKFSIQKGRALKFTEGMGWKEELIEFEHMARTAPIGEAEAYRRSLEDPEEDLENLEKDLQKDLQKDLEAAIEEELGDLEEEEDDEDDIYL